MKNIVRVLSIIIFIAIYCITIGWSIDLPVNSDFQANENLEKESYFSAVSTDLFCHAAQSKVSVDLPVPTFKNPFNWIWVFNGLTEQLLESKLSHYAVISRSFLIQHWKADLVFPFHYFW